MNYVDPWYIWTKFCVEPDEVEAALIVFWGAVSAGAEGASLLLVKASAIVGLAPGMCCVVVVG